MPIGFLSPSRCASPHVQLHGGQQRRSTFLAEAMPCHANSCSLPPFYRPAGLCSRICTVPAYHQKQTGVVSWNTKWPCKPCLRPLSRVPTFWPFVQCPLVWSDSTWPSRERPADLSIASFKSVDPSTIPFQHLHLRCCTTLFCGVAVQKGVHRKWQPKILRGEKWEVRSTRHFRNIDSLKFCKPRTQRKTSPVVQSHGSAQVLNKTSFFAVYFQPARVIGQVRRSVVRIASECVVTQSNRCLFYRLFVIICTSSESWKVYESTRNWANIFLLLVKRKAQIRWKSVAGTG